METARIVSLLGGEKTLGAKVTASSDLIPVLRAGLKYKSFEAIISRTGLEKEATLKTLGLSPRAMARRKGERRLTATESERIYRLARIAALAEETLGSSEKARLWLLRPNRALNGATPLGLLDTDEGTRQVKAVLGRIEHGVFS